MNAGAGMDAAETQAADSGVQTRSGILPAEAIAALAQAGAIRVAEPFAGDQIQPASLDLRLGATAYRVRTRTGKVRGEISA
jgi:dCTP deaminase